MVISWTGAGLSWVLLELSILLRWLPFQQSVAAVGAACMCTVWAMLYTAVWRGRSRDYSTIARIIEAVTKGVVSAGIHGGPGGDDDDPARIAAILELVPASRRDDGAAPATAEPAA
jgi:hypothetical protein